MLPYSTISSDYIINTLPNIISIDKYNDYLVKDYKKQLNHITNLSQVNTRSIEELCPVLNHLLSNGTYYINSGNILLSINPGPSRIENEYFNLKPWYESVSLIPILKWSPHIYTTAHICYTQMVEENKDQSIVLSGALGSGKSFNASKLIHYIFFIASPSDFNQETYEVINKGINVMSIVNSIYHKHNLNSSCSGVVYHIGFNISNEIAFFDIDSEILDCTLPFSENGRSFSLLHGFALTQLESSKSKKKRYNFFSKYYASFSQETIEAFNKKDIETWNIFQEHCRLFLSESEYKDVKSVLEIIILLNEISLIKTKTIINGVRVEVFIINKSPITKRIASLLNVNESKLIEVLQMNSDTHQQKTLLVSLMKYSYWCIHDFILKKVKLKYSQILETKATKYIHIVDFPGQVEYNTLGGLMLNLSNECLNLYSMSNYTSILSQLESQCITIKSLDAPISYKIINALIGNRGVLKLLSKDIRKANTNTQLKDNRIDINYTCTSVSYNYNDLHMETNTLIVPHAVLKLLQQSKLSLYEINHISNTTPKSTPIHEYASNKLRYLFCGLDSIEPFVVHCIHSNNSYIDYFNLKGSHLMISKPKEDEAFIARSLLFNNISKTAIIPVLYWIWNGYEEWIELKTFADDFTDSYDKVLEFIKFKKEGNSDQISINNRPVSNEELCRSVISLFSLENYCSIGSKYLLMKKGGYQSLKRVFENLLASLRQQMKPIGNNSNNASKPMTKNNSKANSNKNKTSKENTIEHKTHITTNRTNHNINVIDFNQSKNKLIQFNIISQLEANNESWLENKYNIDSVLQNKGISNTDSNDIEHCSFLFDINNTPLYLPHIILIQSKYRGFAIRRSFTQMYRYLRYNIIIIQAYIRGFQLRIRFSKFVDCLKHIILIQICYKVRHAKKTEASIRLQRQWRLHSKSIKAKRPIPKSKCNKSLISISPSVSLSTNKPSASISKLKSKQLVQALEQETDKDKIIKSILHNSFLLNETKQTHYGLYQSIKNYNRKKSSAQFVYDSEEKLEDRLIQYGRNLRLRQLKVVSQQLELDLKQYTFKPQLNENTMNKMIRNKHMTKPFNKRCEDYEKKRKNNLEKIKERMPDEVKSQCTFKPRINDKGPKRDVNDLLQWKEKIDREKEEYRKHFQEHNKDNGFDCVQIVNVIKDNNNNKIDESCHDNNDTVLRCHQRKYKERNENAENHSDPLREDIEDDIDINNNDQIEDNEDCKEEQNEEESCSISDVWPIDLKKDYILDSYYHMNST